jgi:ubiquinone/menaquinone biosynthesis C-methylase UbiE
MAFMQPVHPANSTILDLSCGSGLMARRLVRKGGWQRVIAADYSESMLRETKGRFLQERLPVPTLVRADAARLPFRSGSLDAVHAGAFFGWWWWGA